MRLLFAELTRDESGKIAGEGLLVLPVGATEQHGPHLPVGTDSMGAEFVARSAAATVADRFPVAVAPTLWYGSSPHHIPFGGTMSLTAATFLSVLMDIGRFDRPRLLPQALHRQRPRREPRTDRRGGPRSRSGGGHRGGGVLVVASGCRGAGSGGRP